MAAKKKTTAPKDTPETPTIESLKAQLDDLSAYCRRKFRDYSNNWKKFADGHPVGPDEHSGGALKILLPFLAVLVTVAGVNIAADYVANSDDVINTPKFRVDQSGNIYNQGTINPTGAVVVGGAFTVAGDLNTASDIVQESGEIIRNDVDGDQEIVFDDDAVILGQLILDSSVNATNIEDNNLFEIVGRSVDSASNRTDYATIQAKITDVTSATENGQLLFWSTANGSDVLGMSLGHNAGGTHAATIVPNLTLTGDIDIDGGDITAPADLLITPAGAEVHIDGGLSVGDTTAIGDNNLNVVGTMDVGGTAVLAGSLQVNSTFTLGTNGALGLINTSDWDIDVNGNMSGIGTIAANGAMILDNELTITGSIDVATNATVGGTMDVTGATTIDGAVIIDDSLTVTGAVVGTSFDSGTGEVTIDSKYAVVGPGAATPLMVVYGSAVTNTEVVAYTGGILFGGTPTIYLTAQESTATIPYPSAINVTNFTVNGEAGKNLSWLAIGPRP